MSEQRDTGDTHESTELRAQVEEEVHDLAEEAAGEEVERMAERDRAGLDEPSDEVNQSAS